jgi:hypothetical protein
LARLKWSILLKSVRLPLQGPHYSGANWKVAFDIVLEAEDDTAAAVAAIESLNQTPINHNTYL